MVVVAARGATQLPSSFRLYLKAMLLLVSYIFHRHLVVVGW